MGNSFSARIRSLFTGPFPEPEDDVELAPDPEWDELLAWAQVTVPSPAGQAPHDSDEPAASLQQEGPAEAA